MLAKQRKVTSGDLLKELIDLTTENAGIRVHKAYNHPTAADGKERLKKATDRGEKSLTSVQSYKISLGESPSIQKVKSGDFSLAEAKKELLATLATQESLYASVTESRDFTVLQIHLANLKENPSRERTCS